MRALKIFKRVSIIFFCSLFIFVVVLTSTSYKTKAVVPVAIAGAAALLLSALAAQGISFNYSNLDQSGLNDFANNITDGYESNGKTWTDWRDNYQNPDGSFNWASLFVDKKTQVSIASYSNEFLKWFNGLADFVSNKYNLSTSPSGIISNSYLDIVSGRVPLLPSNANNAGVARLYNAVPDTEGTYTWQIKSDLFYRFGLVSDNYSDFYIWRYSLQYSSDNENWINLSSARCSKYFVFAFAKNGSTIGFHADFNKYAPSDSVNPTTITYAFPSSDYDISDIGVSGSLTDGYQDLQDALNQELQDKATSGYGDTSVGVVDLGQTDGVTFEQKIENLIKRILANSGVIAGSGVGVLDNDEVMENDEDEEKVPTSAELNNNIVLVDGLEDFFPFCIPFDLIAMIRKFDVEPEAPVIHWNMNFANVFHSEEIVLDFSAWETAALIFRICCLIGFSIFLILKTRDMIRG